MVRQGLRVCLALTNGLISSMYLAFCQGYLMLALQAAN